MNILLVEDDRDIREMVSQSLAQSDFRITACSNLAEARISMETSDPDCMVVDWMLPMAPESI